jgi:hypothetical protein
MPKIGTTELADCGPVREKYLGNKNEIRGAPCLFDAIEEGSI